MIYILLSLVLFLLWFSIIQLRARIKHQNTILTIYQKLNKAIAIMKQVDKSGAFQAHDEVGETFFLLSITIQELRNYFVRMVENGKRQKKK